MPQPLPPTPSQAADALRQGVVAWLDWYARMGVVDPVVEPGERVQAKAIPAVDEVQRPPPPAHSGREVGRVEHARLVARGCGSLEALARALESFDGCSLKATATRLCFADGHPSARLMLIGEAPGAEEDRQGRPFVGPSGKLLDRMLAAVGLDRSNVWITNLLFWRPPGNRPPTSTEVAICQPFLERQIELLAPRAILFLGGSAARALLDLTEGVTRLRGHRYVYHTAETRTAIPAFVTFHPAYLLRQPLQKRLAWRDLVTLRHEFEDVWRLPSAGPAGETRAM